MFAVSVCDGTAYARSDAGLYGAVMRLVGYLKPDKAGAQRTNGRQVPLFYATGPFKHGSAAAAVHNVRPV